MTKFRAGRARPPAEPLPAAGGRHWSRYAGNYAVRHNPAAYYTTLHGCSSSDVPYSHLASDLKNNKLPAFSFITPNLIDDMHNGTTADGNKWLSRNLPVQAGAGRLGPDDDQGVQPVAGGASWTARS